jgi:hypothetical protein
MPIPKPILAAVFSSLAAILIAVGCGGGGSSLTKAEFVEQADTICRRAEEKKGAAIEKYILELGVSPTKPMTHPQVERQTKKVILPPIRSAITQISELGAPSGEEETIDKLINSLEAASDKTEERSEKTNLKYIDPYAEAAKLARQYGFKACFVSY